jgi:hypothetical protein
MLNQSTTADSMTKNKYSGRLIIDNDGSLVGYAGGLWRKKWLLDHKRKYYAGEKQIEMEF